MCVSTPYTRVKVGDRYMLSRFNQRIRSRLANAFVAIEIEGKTQIHTSHPTSIANAMACFMLRPSKCWSFSRNPTKRSDSIQQLKALNGTHSTHHQQLASNVQCFWVELSFYPVASTLKLSAEQERTNVYDSTVYSIQRFIRYKPVRRNIRCYNCIFRVCGL